MIDWLLSPIDPSRSHEVGLALSWHGRIMVLAWGILAPLAVMAARFGKIWPGQNWPEELDNPTWWRIHWIGQSVVVGLAVLALVLILFTTAPNFPIHRVLGYLTLTVAVFQYSSGLVRGTKGGPTDQHIQGDHFDMTLRRVIFEWLHKLAGYAVLMLAISATLTGLGAANGPNWMFLILLIFWTTLILAFIVLQRSGYAVDTYQAIWGPDPELPGNRRKPIGWGIRRRDQ